MFDKQGGGGEMSKGVALRTVGGTVSGVGGWRRRDRPRSIRHSVAEKLKL